MLTAELMLSGYAHGIFPMAEGRDANLLHWVDPKLRGIFPLDNFHISRSLRRQILAGNYTIRTDTAFRAVVEACAGRAETWINAELLGLYDTLHAAGFAHSLEVWENGELAGGVFGIALGGAFFGESMFTRRSNASKYGFIQAVQVMASWGIHLVDCQQGTRHLISLGAEPMPRVDFLDRLAAEDLRHTRRGAWTFPD